MDLHKIRILKKEKVKKKYNDLFNLFLIDLIENSLLTMQWVIVAMHKKKKNNSNVTSMGRRNWKSFLIKYI